MADRGTFVDDCDHLDLGALYKGGSTEPKPTPCRKERQPKEPKKRGEPIEARDQSSDARACEIAASAPEDAADRAAAWPKGENRHSAIYNNARLAGGCVACCTLTAEQVEAALLPAARENGYAADYGEDEAKPTIGEGVADGMNYPLTIVDDDDFLDDEEPEDAPADASEAENAPAASYFVDAGVLLSTQAPPRERHVEDWFPARTVSMLGGDGGTGKSIPALQLAVATATGSPWIGLDVAKPGSVAYYGAEDDLDEMLRRLAGICDATMTEPAELRGRLHIRSAVAEDSIFATLDRK